MQIKNKNTQIKNFCRFEIPFRKSKKAIAIQTLLGLILTAVAFVAFMSFVMSFFRITPAAETSYYDLIKYTSELSELNEQEILTNKLITMDKNTAIVFFEKNKNETIFRLQRNYDYIGKFKKPDTPECQSRSCSCLCKEIDYKWVDKRNVEITCISLICHTLNLKLAPSINQSILTKELSTGYDSIKMYSNGIILLNNLYVKTLLTIEESSKLSEAFIQKYKGFIGICRKKPCITDETKKILDLSEEIKKKYKECQSKTNPQKSEICYCSKIEAQNLPIDYVLEFQGNKVEEIKILKGIYGGFLFPLYNIDIDFSEEPLAFYDIDKGELINHPGEKLQLMLPSKRMLLTREERALENYKNYIFNFLNKDSFILLKYQTGDVEHTTLASHTSEITEDKWKITGVEEATSVRNFIRITRNTDYVKTIPLCVSSAE